VEKAKAAFFANQPPFSGLPTQPEKSIQFFDTTGPPHAPPGPEPGRRHDGLGGRVRPGSGLSPSATTRSGVPQGASVLNAN